MQFKLSPLKSDRVNGQMAELADTTCDALVIPVPAKGDMALAGAVRSAVDAAVSDGDLALEPGRLLMLHKPAGIKAPRLLLVVVADTSAAALRKAAGSAAQALKTGGARHAAWWLGAWASVPQAARALVQGFEDALYVYRHTKPSAPKPVALTRLTVLCRAPQAKALQQGLKVAESVAHGIELAREWANRPGNHCTPRALAAQARAVGRSHGMKVEVLDRRAMDKLGMGALLAVAKGSEEPPQFIVMRYEGAARTQAPVVLVGKGITFDTGGISIKPAAAMDEMKFDMGGAASVLGTMRAIAEIKPKVNVIGVMPACENMPDGRALKPGDVVTSLSGQTIEILNTDAEGRLILCDALTYVERFKPSVVVDIATLTGACVIALGHHRTAVFSPDDELAAALQTAGDEGLDLAWRMPLDDEYAEGLKSNFADVANVGGRAGGAITAALFLKRFAKAYPWAHLDIAGSAWKDGSAKGSTGRPVALLTHFVLAKAGA